MNDAHPFGRVWSGRTPRWSAMSESEPPGPDTSEPEERTHDDTSWQDRVREWASKLGELVDNLLPAPRPAPVLVPVPVRNRRRRR